MTKQAQIAALAAAYERQRWGMFAFGPKMVADLFRWFAPLRGTPGYNHDWLIARGLAALSRWPA